MKILVYVDSYLLKYILDECTYKVVNNDSVLICNVIFFSFQKGARESTTESDLEAEEKGYDFESDENEVSDPDEMSDGWLESDADSSEDSDWASLEDCAASSSDSSSETDEDRAEEESRNTVRYISCNTLVNLPTSQLFVCITILAHYIHVCNTIFLCYVSISF